MAAARRHISARRGCGGAAEAWLWRGIGGGAAAWRTLPQMSAPSLSWCCLSSKFDSFSARFSDSRMAASENTSGAGTGEPGNITCLVLVPSLLCVYLRDWLIRPQARFDMPMISRNSEKWSAV